MDRRAQRIRLRTGGRRAYAEARQIAVSLQQDVLTALPAAQQERFLETLAVVADACRAAAEASARPGPKPSGR